MILLLDIGNTRIKWATAKERALGDSGDAPHAGDPAAALAQISLPRADQVWIAHVMGAEHEEKLSQAIARQFGKPPRIARAGAELAGLRSAYAQPNRLGIDRWLSMSALWSELRAPFCVVSAGTALTFDAVDARGQHLGGVIAPGLAAMQSAVHGSTRFSVTGTDHQYDDHLGNDTESCVRQGASHAAAGLIDRLGARHAGERFITGGDADRLAGLLTTRWHARPQLVLEGLLCWGLA
jgi:type III pantothenate kinase